MNKPLIAAAVLLSTVVAAITYCSPAIGRTEDGTENNAGPELASKPGKTMRAFRSDQELNDFFKQLAEKQRKKAESRLDQKSANSNMAAASPSASAADGVAV